MAELRVLKGWAIGRVFPDLPPRLTIGRDPADGIQIPDSNVSRSKIVLAKGDDGAWTVTDLGATNGVHVNGVLLKVKLATPLRHGDKLRVAGHVMEFVDHAASQGSLRDSVPGDPRALSNQPAKSVAVSKGYEPAEQGSLTIVNLRAADFLDRTVPKSAVGDPAAPDRIKRHLKLLEEATGAVASILDLDEVLYRIQELVVRETKPDLCCLFVLDATGESAIPRVQCDAKGPRKVESAKDVTFSSTILGHAIRNRVAVLSHDVSREFGKGQGLSIQQYQIQAALCVPFIFQDKVLGALYLHNRPLSEPLTQAHLELCGAICNLTSVAIQNAKLLDQVRVEERRRTNLSRYFSPGVVDRIMLDDASLAAAGRRIEVSIVFSDLRGFTALSERTDPEVLVPLLNEYFSAMVAVIFEHGGTIDKFIGDAILAYFGGLDVAADAAKIARTAVACARAMQLRLADLNAAWEVRKRPRLDMGIGVHRGVVTMGDIGSEQRREFTILGDPVNTACRLSDQAESGQVVLSESIVSLLDGSVPCRELSEVQLKGKGGTTRLYLAT